MVANTLGPQAGVVYDKLSERIVTGALAVGARIPSQKELAHQYGVASMTVRQALNRLADEGLVIAKMGCGTYVIPRRAAESDARLAAMDDDARRQSGHGLITDERQGSGSHLMEAPRQERRAGETVADRLALLQAAAIAFSEPVTPEGVAAVVVEECVSASGAAARSLFTPGSAGDLELIHSVGYDQCALAGYARIPLNASAPLAEAARAGEPVWLQADGLRDRYTALEAMMRTNGHEAVVAVPLLTQSRVIGVLGLSFVEGRELCQDDRAFILALASQAAQALDRARLFAAERTARLAAEAAQARLQAAFRAATVPLMVSDPGGEIELWNPACERVFGWTEDEVLGGANPLVPADAPANPHAFLDASLPEAPVSNRELRQRHKDGHTIDLLASVAPFTDQAGAVTGVVAISIDISEQKRAEERLRVSEERFRAIFNHAPVGVMVADASGRYVQTNLVFQRLLGYTAAELSALTYQDVTHPDDLEEDLHLHDDLVTGKCHFFQSEKRYIRKNGKTAWVGLSVSLLRGWNSRLVSGDGDEPDFTVAIVEDITEQKQAEDALVASEQRYRSVVETSLDGIIMTDLSGTITFANRQMAALLALPSPDELTGRHIIELIAAHDRRAGVCKMENLVRQGSVTDFHFALLREDGASVPCELSASLVRDTAGVPRAATAVIRDMTERQAYEEQLRRQALHDPLTDLPNRTLFNDRLAQVLLSARREEEPFALLLVDLDRFKEINDTLGHGTGDTILQQVAVRLRDALRKSDTVARLGGDEFAIILPGADEQGAIQVINALLNDFAEPFVLGQHPFYLEFSIGVALFPQHAKDIAVLLQRADVAMYTAKRSGGSYAVYEAETDPNSERRLALMAGLRRAIDEDQLVLHYQSKVDLETGQAAQVEALVQWNHPQFGFVPPDQFISLAEHTGLIRLMSRWVLNEALRQIAGWRAAGHDIAVAVNLSACNLQERDLVDSITGLLAKWDVPASSLGIEITESTLMADPDHAMATLTLLHDVGITISIDDFGTGYSSLAYLQRLPADEVKIDRAFVVGMSTPGSGSSSIVRSVVDLGHTLELRVVAEGVERQQDLDILGVMGCDVAQGYYLGKPMPAGEYAAWLDDWRQRDWFLPSGAAASWAPLKYNRLRGLPAVAFSRAPRSGRRARPLGRPATHVQPGSRDRRTRAAGSHRVERSGGGKCGDCRRRGSSERAMDGSG